MADRDTRETRHTPGPSGSEGPGGDLSRADIVEGPTSAATSPVVSPFTFKRGAAPGAEHAGASPAGAPVAESREGPEVSPGPAATSGVDERSIPAPKGLRQRIDAWFAQPRVALVTGAVATAAGTFASGELLDSWRTGLVAVPIAVSLMHALARNRNSARIEVAGLETDNRDLVSKLFEFHEANNALGDELARRTSEAYEARATAMTTASTLQGVRVDLAETVLRLAIPGGLAGARAKDMACRAVEEKGVEAQAALKEQLLSLPRSGAQSVVAGSAELDSASYEVAAARLAGVLADTGVKVARTRNADFERGEVARIREWLAGDSEAACLIMDKARAVSPDNARGLTDQIAEVLEAQRKREGDVSISVAREIYIEAARTAPLALERVEMERKAQIEATVADVFGKFNPAMERVKAEQARAGDPSIPLDGDPAFIDHVAGRIFARALDILGKKAESDAGLLTALETRAQSLAGEVCREERSA